MKISGKTAIGIYLDSTADAVDVSLMKTDGLDILTEPVSLSRPYPEELKQRILSLKYPQDYIDTPFFKELSQTITQMCVEAVRDLLAQHPNDQKLPDVIGFSGQNLHQKKQENLVVTLGNADILANTFQCPVVDRFIRSDLKAGGTGGPLFPVFLEARTRKLDKPLGVVLLRGITTVTAIGSVGELQSFDAGIGVLLLDRWMQKRAGLDMDYDGQFGARGQINDRLLNRLLKHPFLNQPPPKTVSIDDFNDLWEQLQGLSPADGAATITAFVAHSIRKAQDFLKIQPTQWILAGGGSYNPTLVRQIKNKLNEPVHLADEYGWDKSTFGAQGYAFLAVRTLMGLPVLFPETTGISSAMPAGLIHYPTDMNR